MSGWWQISTSVGTARRNSFLDQSLCPSCLFEGNIFLLWYFLFARFSLPYPIPPEIRSRLIKFLHCTDTLGMWGHSILLIKVFIKKKKYIINQSDPSHGKILHFHVDRLLLHFTITPAKLTLIQLSICHGKLG